MMKKILYSILTLTLGLVLSGSGCNVDALDPDTIDAGVEINGITWATRNVAALGKFAKNTEDAGMFYQWNRKTAYSVTDPVKPAWNLTPISAPWAAANDPCPDGWHVPTAAEMGTLLDATNVDYAWEVNGGRFTDKAIPANSIFLPAAGGRWDYDGNLFDLGTMGFYWTTWTNGTIAGNFNFYSGGNGSSNNNYCFGHSVRCVKD